MLPHLAWTSADLAPSIGSTALKKAASSDGFPQLAPLKKLKHYVRGVTSRLTALKAGVANHQS